MNRSIVCLLLLSVSGLRAQTLPIKAADTLVIATLDQYPAQPARLHRIGWNYQRTIGLTLMLLGGWASYETHRVAEKAYTAYRQAGDHEEIKRLYDKAVRYDRLSGWSYVGMQTGFLLFVWSFDLPAK